MRGLVITFQCGGSEKLAPARVDLGEGNTAPNVAIVQFVIGRCFNSLPDGNLLLKGLGAVARLGEGEKLCSWLVFITNAQQSPGRTIDFCYPHLHCFQRDFQIILQMPFQAIHHPRDAKQVLQLRPVQQEGPKLQKIWVEGGIFEEKALLQCSSWRQVRIVRQRATF